MMTEKICEFWRKAVSMVERRRREINSSIPLIIQARKVKEVVSKLRQRNLRVKSVIDSYIFAEVPDWATAEEISRWREVEYITVEKFFTPYAVGIDELIKRISVSQHPILCNLSLYDLYSLGIKVRPLAEIPNPMRAMIENILSLSDVLKDPKRMMKMIRGIPPVISRVDWQLVTYTRRLLGVPRDNRLSSRTLVGAIDSECVHHPAFRKDFEYIMLNEPLTQSHGTWISTCAFGDPAPTRYGLFYPVASAADNAYTFVKVFGAFGGCSSEQVMKAMEICAKRGVKVVNMSLGGPLTDAVDKEPECVLLDKLSREYGTIFVVAAGNEDGKFEIGSPGAALSALTVAAVDWKDAYKTSSYSSRGWQGIYYREHKDVFEEHLEKFGDIFLKPDCAGIGGDRDSQIVAGATPWYDGIFDFIPDGFEPMIGTSMATPHIAGIVSLAVDRGIVWNVRGVKDVLRKIKVTGRLKEGGEEMMGKTIEKGWGVLTWPRFLVYRWW